MERYILFMALMQSVEELDPLEKRITLNRLHYACNTEETCLQVFLEILNHLL